jgi:hypothetical protein
MRWLLLVATLPFLLHCKKESALDDADLATKVDMRTPRDMTAAGDDLALDPLLDLTGVPLDLLGCTHRSPGLAVVAVANDKSLFIARHSSAAGWHEKVTTTQVMVEEVAARASGNQLVVAVRESSNQLSTGIEVDCIALPPTLVALPSASTPVRPALRVTTTNDVVFRGAINNDHRYYVQRFTDSGATAAVTQGNLLSLTTPALYGTDDAVGLVFTGDSGTLYDGVTSGSGGNATAIAGATSTRPPAVVMLSDGRLLMVFTGNDTNLYFAVRTSLGADMGTTWSAPRSLCDGQSGCLIASLQPPTLTLDSAGVPIVLWVGKDTSTNLDKGVYASTFDGSGAGFFGAAVQVSDEVTHDPIAAAPGADGATIEAAWVRDGDGFLRHARFSGTWQAAATIEGKAFRSKPELVRIP